MTDSKTRPGKEVAYPVKGITDRLTMPQHGVGFDETNLECSILSGLLQALSGPLLLGIFCQRMRHPRLGEEVSLHLLLGQKKASNSFRVLSVMGINQLHLNLSLQLGAI